MTMLVSKIFQPLKDFLFIVECFHCGEKLNDGERRICKQCWNSLSLVGEKDFTFKVLKERFSAEYWIDDFVTLYYFEKGKLLQSLAHSLKYEEVTEFGFELGVQLADKLQGKIFDCIIPVPLNKRKERERGYNQSDFIAQGIASVMKVPLFTDAVTRIKYTTTQTHLNAVQRKENIAEAFQVRDADCVQKKHILIVDDIITTGSTIQELAKVLRNSGATAIIAASAGLAKLGEET